MSKLLKVALITIGCLCVSATAFAATFTVNPGLPEDTYNKHNLGDAIIEAELLGGGPHRIEIVAGTYNDYGLTITTASVIGEIVGEDKATVIFEAPGGMYQAVNFLDLSGTVDLSISGITVKGYVYGLTNSGTGIDGLTVEDCIFDDNGEDGFDPMGPPYLSDGGAIRLYDCDGGLFQNLEIMNGERGIRLDDIAGDGSDGNQILTCTIHDNDEYGIGLYHEANNNLVDGCTVYNNPDRGIQIGWGGANVGNVVQNCTVYDNSNDGILLVNATSGSILNNTVYGNSFTDVTFSEPGTQAVHGGIVLLGSSGIIVRYNTAYGNGDGVSSDYGIWSNGNGNNIRYNCLFDHDGVEGLDDGDGTSLWKNNYYGYANATNGLDPNDANDIVANGYYDLDGTATERDTAPTKFNNSAVGPTTVDVGDPLHIDINWTIPDCAGMDEVYLGAYNFTVTWSPAAALTLDAADHSRTYFGENGTIYTTVTTGPGTATFAATGFEEPGLGNGTLATLDFTTAATGAVTITVSSEYLDEEGNQLPAGSTPLAVTIQDLVSPTCEIVENDPIGTDTYSSYVDLIIEGHVTDNYDLKYAYYQIVGEVGWTAIGPLDGLEDDYGPFTVDLSTVPHGTGYELQVLIRDDSNNDQICSYFFDVDKQGPVVTSFTLSDDDCPVTAGYTNQVTVTANITATGDPVEMDFRVDAAWGGTPYMAFDDDGPVDITGGTPVDGATYEVKVRLYDIYGNQGGAVADNIIYDETEATLSGYGLSESLTTLLTTTGDATWGTQTVNIAWYVTADPAASEGDVLLDCDYVGWTAAVHNFTVNLPGEGTWYVWFNTMERAGNMQTPVVASIVVDQTEPIIDVFEFQDLEGEVCTEKANINWHVEFTDLDVVEMWSTAVDPPPPPGDPGWSYQHTSDATPFDGSSPWNCVHGTASVEGMNTRWIMLEDAAGNFSAPMSASIELDSFDPTLTGLMIVDRAATDAPIYDQYSNETTVNLDLTGLSADAISLVITEDNWVTADTVSITSADPLTYEYAYQGTPADCPGKNYIKVKSMDCAGRMSLEKSNYFRFDDEVPTVDAFSGPAIWNSFIGVPLTLAASDDCNVWKMRFSEDPAFAGATWEAYNTSKSFDLDPGPGDVPRTIYVQVSDWAGNISLSSDITVEVDTQAPEGLTMTVQQDPLGTAFSGALAGYTNSATQNEIIGITADPDAVEMQVKTSGGTNVWTAMAATFNPLTIDGTVDGPKTVQMRFKDGAGNIGGWMNQVITLDTQAPPAPPALSATSVPVQSMDMSWGAVADVQSYHLVYVRTGEYPLYGSGLPPHAMTPPAGTFVAEVEDPEIVWPGPYQDIYAISIWSRDYAGNLSTTPNTDIWGTNYILGDFYDTEGATPGWDGWIDKEHEVVDLLLAYGSVAAGPHWDENLDINPTNDATRFGCPQPDGDIDFWDLAFFGLNYRDYRLGVIRSGGSLGKVAPFAGAVTMTAEIPTPITEGGLYSVSVKVDNAWALAGYHVTLDFNHDDFELVSVQPGAIYEKSGEHFFFTEESSLIDVASVPFTEPYDGEEIFTVQLRSKTGAEIELKDVELIFVNEDVTEIPVIFNTEVVAKTGLIPNAFTLSQNYPNPFNPATNIQFGVPTATDYRLTIYNVLGQVVETFEGYAEPGYVNIRWDAADQATGIYLYRIHAGTFEATRKMVLIK